MTWPNDFDYRRCDSSQLILQLRMGGQELGFGDCLAADQGAGDLRLAHEELQNGAIKVRVVAVPHHYVLLPRPHRASG